MHLDSRRITRGFVTRFLSALECLPFAKTLAHSENTRRAFYSAGEADYNDVQWAHVSIHSSATDDSLSLRRKSGFKPFCQNSLLRKISSGARGIASVFNPFPTIKS